MADFYPPSGGGGGSGGGSGGFYGGGGKTTTKKKPSVARGALGNQLRNAIARGNVEKVKRLAKSRGFSDKDRKALLFLAGSAKPHGFVERLGSDIGKTVTALPAGIGATAVAAGKEFVVDPNVAFAEGIYQGDPGKVLENLPGAAQVVRTGVGIAKGAAEGEADPNLPFSSGIGASFRRTGNRLTDPQQALKDYSEHPFSTAVEDAANLAIVTGAGARVARVAGLEKTANVLSTGSRALGEVGNAPLLPVSPAARVAGRGLNRVSELASESRLRPLAEVLRATPEQRATRRTLVEEQRQTGEAANTYVTHVAQPIEKLLPKPAEQQALQTIGVGQAEALATIRHASPERFDVFIKDNAQQLGDITVEAAHLAADYADKTNPAWNARVDQALEIGRASREQRQVGYQQRGGSEEQLGYAPLTHVVESAVAPVEAKLAPLQERLDRLGAQVEKARAQAEKVSTRQGARVARAREMRTVGEFGSPLGHVPERMVPGAAVPAIDVAARAQEIIQEWRTAAESGEGPARLYAQQQLQQTPAEVQRAAVDAASFEVSRQTPAAPEVRPGRPGLLTAKDINAERAVGRTQGAAGRAQGEADLRLKMAERRYQALQNRIARVQARVSSVRANTEQSIEAAPARLRPVLQANRAAISELVAQENTLRGEGAHAAADTLGEAAGEIPNTLAKLEAAGVDPEHFIRTVDKQPGRYSAARIVRRVKLSEQRRRTGQGAEVRSTHAQTIAELARMREVIRNETVAKLEAMPFTKTAGEITGRQLEAPTLAELDAAGYAPLDPLKKIDVSTKVVPKAVAEMTHTYWRPDGQFEKVMQHVYDPITHGFKTMVLPLSPSWQVGNLIGNSIMATLGAGVDPVTLGLNMIRSIREYRKTGEFAGPGRLRQSGSTYETLDYLGSGGVRDYKGIRKVSPVKLGYKANQVVDDLFRSAVYLSKKGQGFSDEMALRQSLRAMGDFTNLSPFERRVVRRIVPFYAWQKHMVKLAFSMPIEHPLRTAFILSLAKTFGGDRDAWEQLLPGYQQGGVDVGGGGVLQTSSLVPFATPFQYLTNPRTALSNLSPQLKAIVENITGLNTYTGRPFTRPPGTGRVDESGNLLPTPPGPLEQLRRLSPQLRLYDQFSGRSDIARYEDGSPVLFRGDDGKRHPIPTKVDSKAALLKYVGLTVRSKKTLRQIVDGIIARRVRNYTTAHPSENITKKKKSSSSNIYGG